MTPLQEILAQLRQYTYVGQKTSRLADEAADMIRAVGAEPAFLNYQPSSGKGPLFPSVLCVSINNEVIHGIPGERQIVEGDVVKLDLGLIKDGQYDDGATTVLVGDCSSAARRLVQSTQEALAAALSEARAGKTTHDIARVVQAVAQKYDVYVIHGYGGHGIGEKLHMPPHVPNEIGRLINPRAVKLKPGMRLAIEPMFAIPHGHTYVSNDGWTVKLEGHGGLAAHFEETITIPGLSINDDETKTSSAQTGTSEQRPDPSSLAGLS